MAVHGMPDNQRVNLGQMIRAQDISALWKVFKALPGLTHQGVHQRADDITQNIENTLGARAFAGSLDFNHGPVSSIRSVQHWRQVQ